MEEPGRVARGGSPAQRVGTVAKSHSKVGSETEARPNVAAVEVETGSCPISPHHLQLSLHPQLLCSASCLPSPRGVFREAAPPSLLRRAVPPVPILCAATQGLPGAGGQALPGDMPTPLPLRLSLH